MAGLANAIDFIGVIVFGTLILALLSAFVARTLLTYLLVEAISRTLVAPWMALPANAFAH